jgi:hypothetical protein
MGARDAIENAANASSRLGVVLPASVSPQPSLLVEEQAR